MDVLIATFIGDTGAYFGGRTWGTRALAPRISPGKTVEGLLAGVLAGTGRVLCSRASTRTGCRRPRRS